jgi:hypothetical protein
MFIPKHHAACHYVNVDVGVEMGDGRSLLGHWSVQAKLLARSGNLHCPQWF